MTFSNLILLARKRLHDYRDENAGIITDASDDGIRWSSDELQQVCRGALQEMLRTFRAMKLHDYIHTDVQYQRIVVSLSTSGEVQNLPPIPSGNGFIRVERITTPDLGIIYHRVKHSEFDSKRWRITAADSNDTNLTEGVFASWWDTVNNELVTLVYPFPTSTVENCIAQVIVPLNSLFTLTSIVELPFIDIDDIILDYIEMHGALIDHDRALVQYNRELINTKLQELKLELQKSNR